jgi:hypothetical protein
MRAKKRRGPGPSSTLLTPDRAGNVVGVDPHKRTLSATIAILAAGSSPASTSGCPGMGIGRLRRGRWGSG